MSLTSTERDVRTFAKRLLSEYDDDRDDHDDTDER